MTRAPYCLVRLTLMRGGGGGHDHRGFHAGELGRVGHALGVVAGGGGDEALLLLLLRQFADLIIGAADLVGAGDLQVFRLEIDLVSAQVGKIFAVDKLCVRDHAAQHGAGFLESFQCQHKNSPSIVKLRQKPRIL